VADLVSDVLPQVPENIRIVAAGDQVNTYDLVNIAFLGMVYTTTVGMEMAMSGVPVIVVGKTHYRGKGFTIDPSSWDEYFYKLEEILANPSIAHMSEEQVNSAWQYAYCFFFDYPRPYPWHLLHFQDNYKEWPLARVLSEEGLARYGKTFELLTGDPITWTEM
jgi:capsule polysaccharide export protein KpsC/LpsZ